MNRTVWQGLLVAAAVLCGSIWAQGAAQQGTRAQAERRANGAYNDEMSIRSAAETSMSEVDLGKLAEQRAQSPEVKRFAALMVEEHSKITTQLKSLGMSEHINLPTSVGRHDADNHRKIQTVSGAAFDRDYTHLVFGELEREITEFKQGASATNRPALKDFYERTIPTLEAELQQAKQLEAHTR